MLTGVRDRLGTLVAVVLGTTVLTAFLILLTSAGPRVPDRLAGFSVLVRGVDATNHPDEFAEPVPWPDAAARRLAGDLKAVPGVETVALDRTFYAQPVIGGRPVPSVTEGHAWHGAGGPGPGAVIVPDGLGVPAGADLTLLTATGPERFRVAGHSGMRGVHLSTVDAARLGPGVRVIGLTGRADPAAVRAVLGARGAVLTGADRARAEARDDARVRWIGGQVLAATTALAAFACVFLAGSASAYAVNRRRREIGLLRAAGATPRQVRRVLYGSALRLGLGAALPGVVLGGAAAVPLARFLVRAGFEPAGFTVRWTPWVLAAGAAAGPLVALAGTVVAARRAARVAPIEALRVAEVEPHAMSRGRWVAGLLAGAGAVAAGLAAATAADPSGLGTYALFGAMALVSAAALLAPAVVPALIRVLLGPLTGVVATLARESARTAVRRTAATATPVLFTVAFAVFVTGTAQTSAAAWTARRAQAVPAGAVLVPDGTPGLSDAAGRAPLDTTAWVDGRAVVTMGSDRVAPGTALAPGPGGTVSVTFADGTSEALRVTGTVPPGPFPAELMLSRDTVRAHDPSALAPAVVPAPPGPPPAGARIAGGGDLARPADAGDDRLVAAFTVLLLIVSAGAGGVAVAGALLATSRWRRPDYRVLRLAGASGRQVAGAVALETLVVVAIGALLGGAAGLLAVAGTARSLGAQVGTDVPVLVSGPATAAAVAACLVLALAAALPPAWRTRTAT